MWVCKLIVAGIPISETQMNGTAYVCLGIKEQLTEKLLNVNEVNKEPTRIAAASSVY